MHAARYFASLILAAENGDAFAFAPGISIRPIRPRYDFMLIAILVDASSLFRIAPPAAAKSFRRK